MIRIKAKIFNEKNVRRFSVDSLNDLVNKLNQYNNTPTKEYNIYYQDDDGDWILMENLNEFEELKRHYEETQKVLKMELRRKTSPVQDLLHERAEKWADTVKETAHEVKTRVEKRRQSIKNSDEYKATKEKLGKTFEGIQKALDQVAETTQHGLNEFVNYINEIMEDKRSKEDTRRYQYPTQTPSYQQQEQQKEASTNTQLTEIADTPVYQPPTTQTPTSSELTPSNQSGLLVIGDQNQPLEPSPLVQHEEEGITLDHGEESPEQEEVEQEEVEQESSQEEEEDVKMKMLMQMGFMDREKNRELLDKHNDNLSLVVSTLLHQ